jgi:hypothetical protein
MPMNAIAAIVRLARAERRACIDGDSSSNTTNVPRIQQGHAARHKLGAQYQTKQRYLRGAIDTVVSTAPRESSLEISHRAIHRVSQACSNA